MRWRVSTLEINQIDWRARARNRAVCIAFPASALRREREREDIVSSVREVARGFALADSRFGDCIPR